MPLFSACFSDMSRFTEWTISDIPSLMGRSAVNPVPLDAQPRSDDDGSGHVSKGAKGSVAAASSMQAFDIRTTSQAAAQAALDRT
jgi:hypothetical protein